jgi:acetyl-CoA carboxylase alpha subunit
MLAAGAIFYFWQKAQQAKEEAIAFADGLDKLNAAMNAMSNTQLRGAIADANNSIRAQKEAVADLQSEVDSLRDRYQNFTPAAQKLLNLWGKVQISPANRRRCLMNWLARREILRPQR